jgi:macrolide transport system ATP-binding/permease protein
MRRLREWIVRFGGLLNKRRRDRELDEEIESHLQLHIEDNLRLGLTPEEARHQAMITLGGIESTKEAYRDQRVRSFYIDPTNALASVAEVDLSLLVHENP